MNYIFYLTDSLGSTTAVVGTGADYDTAEADALAKWDAAMSSRGDYGERAPIVGTTFSLLGSIEDVPSLSDTHKTMGTDPDDTMPGLIL
jgi:hypothetical protein